MLFMSCFLQFDEVFVGPTPTKKSPKKTEWPKASARLEPSCATQKPTVPGETGGFFCLNLGCPNIEICGHHLPNMRPPFPHDFVGEERRLIFFEALPHKFEEVGNGR